MYITTHCHLCRYMKFGVNFDTQFGIPNITLIYMFMDFFLVQVHLICRNIQDLLLIFCNLIN